MSRMVDASLHWNLPFDVDWQLGKTIARSFGWPISINLGAVEKQQLTTPQELVDEV